jgi:polysaccharide chain length determinant protein (PEP-CTERM system associated)
MDELLRQLITVLRGMWHRRWLGLVVAWLVAVVGAIVVLYIPNRYEASARIFVDTDSLLKPLIAGLAIAPNVNQQITMLTRTLVSRPNIEKLMRSSDMDLLARTQAEKDRMVDQLMKEITLTGGRDNLYSISYRATNPERARRVVQNFVSMFVESGLGDKRRDAEGAIRFVDDQIKNYEARMAEVEGRIKDFRLANMELLGTGQSGNYVAQIATLTEELKRVDLELRSAEQSRDALKQQLSSGEIPSMLPGRSAASVTPEIDARIDAQKRQIDDLLRRYTDQHPDILASRRLIAQLEEERRKAIEDHQKSLKDEEGKSGAPTNPVFQQIKIAISEAEANVAALRARSGELKSRMDRLADAAKRRPEVEKQMAQMERDHNNLRRNYESLVARREQASMGQEVEASGVGAEFRLIEPPRASSKPVFPDRIALLLTVLALAVGGGLLASFAYAQILPTVADTPTLRQIGNRPVLGSVSMLMSGSMLRRRRLHHAAFGSAVAGLMVFYGAWTAWVAWTLNR